MYMCIRSLHRNDEPDFNSSANTDVSTAREVSNLAGLGSSLPFVKPTSFCPPSKSSAELQDVSPSSCAAPDVSEGIYAYFCALTRRPLYVKSREKIMYSASDAFDPSLVRLSA